MRKLVIAAASAASLACLASPASADPIPCANTDISPTAIDCAGFVAGNVINNGGGPADPVTGFSPNEQAMAALLLELGFVYAGDSNGIEQTVALTGTTNVKFLTALTGLTIIGVHYGNGQGSPGGQGSGNDTAFYLFNATGLTGNTFTLNYSASSTITLFQTGVVPEPGTWAMMLLGFGMIGFAVRRQRNPGRIAQVA